MNNELNLFDSKTPTRKDICDLQNYLSGMPQEQNMVTNHYFANGMYVREVTRPAGTLIVGKVHKHEHIFAITKGKLNVWCEDGEMKELIAPCVLVSKPGTKRVTFAVEDTTAMTIHRTDNTDLDEIEKEIIEEDLTALYDSSNNLKNGLENKS